MTESAEFAAGVLDIAAEAESAQLPSLGLLLLTAMVLLALILPFALARRGPRKVRSEQPPKPNRQPENGSRDNPTVFGPSGHYDHIGGSNGGTNADDIGGDD
ncbi:hypothetical protein [Actinoalloteichus hymeniacidonis]|uniref:hypothetical protein n=1 Tax=Actinoalloteichus hymeniacidonis TaxID=340345 RepID=UPI0012F83828|nr:hypothetical protein [Actinoalloteichus hymeniacidonis]MBB5910780.1 hypothetical protein [Actinoalloteichus hymeniacidonis]